MLTSSGWQQRGQTHARGQAHDGNSLLRAAKLAELFDGLSDSTAWTDTAASLNGSFAVASQRGERTLAAVDRLRSIPLFFADTTGGFAVADDAQVLRDRVPNAPVDALSAREFRLAGYVTGARTLIESLWQIPAGHCLAHAPGTALTHALRRYHAFRHRDFFTDDESTLIDRLAGVHERVFRRLIDDVGQRPLAVPLSGGYDSRLIGVMLRDLGCRDVFCYTYGAPGNWETEISRELARYLGFRWTMVPYSAQRWRAWSALPAFDHYFRTAGQLCASPHFQDWPAVHELIAGKELSPDAVFVPGHSGDFLAGSHIPKHFPTLSSVSRTETLNALFDAHYALWDWPEEEKQSLRETLAMRIEETTGPLADATPEAAADAFEMWDLAERQAKFIVNSVRVYDAFGHEWRLPLFDTELMDFWSRVPLQWRAGRRLYFAYVDRHQRLPVRQANTDLSAPAAAMLDWINKSGLRPYAKRLQHRLRRARWRREYEGGAFGWFALVTPEEFRENYTGREIGHSFFAARYLDLVRQ